MTMPWMRSSFGALRVLLIACLGLYAPAVKAASLTNVQDIMTRQLISTVSNHEVRFVTPSGVSAPSHTITLVFAPGFSLSGLDATDILLSHGVTTGFETTETLAASAAAGVWGAGVASQTITLTAPTDTLSGEIAAGEIVVIRIGTAAGAGADRITNPSTAGTYSLQIAGAFGDTGGVIIPITSGDSLSVSATVPAPASTPVPPSDTGGGGATTPPAPPPPPVVPPPVVPEPAPPPPPPVAPTSPTLPVSPAPGSPSSGGGGAGSGGGSAGGGGVYSIRFLVARVVSVDERSVLLSWETDQSASGLVEYGASEYSARLADEEVRRVHTLRVTGLEPTTSYRFRITARVPGGAVVSTSLTAQTGADITAPTNPASLRAIGQDRQVALEWTNPVNEDFADVVLVARDDRFATNVNEGRVVYTGTAQAVIDGGLLSGRTYFYSLFARDRSGNTSSGTIASAQTWNSFFPVPPQGSVTDTGAFPPSSSLTPTTRTLAPTFSEESGSFSFQSSDGVYEAFSEQAVNIVLPGRVDGVSLRSAEVRVGAARYQFVKGREGSWITTLTLPREGRVGSIVQAELEDGSRGQAQAVFLMKPRFFIREEFSSQAVSGTEIRVMYKQGAEWSVWDPRNSGQPNPFVTEVDGLYGFFVEPGLYRLLVRREGFLSLEKEIEVKGNLLGMTLLLRSSSPVVQILADAREVLQSPAVQAVNRQVVAPVAVAVAVTNLTTAASAANVFRYLYFLFTQPLLLIGRRKRKQWGVVYNALSKQPIDLAVIRLVDAGTGRVMQTRITDTQGRYSFFVKPGTYRLQVVKQGFQFPSKYLANDREDGALLDLYHGELVEVKTGGAMIAANVPVDPQDQAEKTPKKLLAEKRWRGVQRVSAGAGLVTSLGSLLLSPGWLTGGLFIFQVVTYALFYRLAAASRPKDWGIVYDQGSKRGIEQTVVRIFDKRFHKLLETQITDKNGKYAFFAGPNVYTLMADKPGYESFRSGDIDLTQAKTPVVSEKIVLQPKK